MNKEIIKNLDRHLLLELQENLLKNLKYQRKYWLNNDKSRISTTKI